MNNSKCPDIFPAPCWITFTHIIRACVLADSDLYAHPEYESRDVLAFRDPKEAGLPSPTINSSYIFAREDGYLCYPNNYNHFVNYYRNTFQHGGVSLEEMIVPVVVMESK